MSITEIFEISIQLLQVFVLFFVIYLSSKLMVVEGNGPFPAFFTFAMISFLLSGFYSSIYTILRPDTRMPFAVDEIAECASLLLISAGLEAVAGKNQKFNIGALIFSFLFILVNIALWIAWSGEWGQDIIFGIPYIYITYLLLRGMFYTHAINMAERYIAAIASSFLVLFHTIRFYVFGTAATAVDIFCVVFEYGIAGWLFAKCIFALRQSVDEEKSLYLTCTLYLWTILITYMSADALYDIALFINTMTIPLMLMAVKKNCRLGVREDDVQKGESQ